MTSCGLISGLPTTRSVAASIVSTRAPETRKLFDDLGEVPGLGVFDGDVPIADGPADQECPGFDAVGNDVVLRPTQAVHPPDPDDLLADPLDPRPHLDQELGQGGDLGLQGAVSQHGFALGQRGGHEQILGPPDGLFVELDVRTVKPGGLGLDGAVLEREVGAQLLHSGDVEVDRPGTDGAPAGESDVRLAVSRQERPQDEHRGPHRPHQLVGRLGRDDFLGPDGKGAPGEIRLRAQLLHQSQDRQDVLDQRDVPESELFLGQERGDDGRENGVLGAADPDPAAQRARAVAEDAEFFHL